MTGGVEGLQVLPAGAGSVEFGLGREPQKTLNNPTACVLRPSPQRSPVESDAREAALVPEQLWSEGQAGGRAENSPTLVPCGGQRRGLSGTSELGWISRKLRRQPNVSALSCFTC